MIQRTIKYVSLQPSELLLIHHKKVTILSPDRTALAVAGSHTVSSPLFR